jgi:hypothetical protein
VVVLWQNRDRPGKLSRRLGNLVLDHRPSNWRYLQTVGRM